MRDFTPLVFFMHRRNGYTHYHGLHYLSKLFVLYCILALQCPALKVYSNMCLSCIIGYHFFCYLLKDSAVDLDCETCIITNCA